MKRIRNKRILVFLLLSVWAAVFPTKACAAGTDTGGESISLTVCAAYSGEVLAGVEYRLYKVADDAENGSYTVRERFQRYPVDLNGFSENADTAYTLSAYAERDRIVPDDTAATDRNGRLAFPSSGKSIRPGLYLLTASPVSHNGETYGTAPLLLRLPYRDEAGNLQPDVTVVGKFSRCTEEDQFVKRRVVKLWAGDSVLTRPKQITVQLLCNGKMYSSVNLSADNNWSYEWTALPGTSDGSTPNRWSVAEEIVNGYTVQITSAGTAFVITNTAVNPTVTDSFTVQGKLPQTGLLWWPVPILTGLGIVFLLLGSVIRTHNRDE